MIPIGTWFVGRGRLRCAIFQQHSPLYDVIMRWQSNAKSVLQISTHYYVFLNKFNCSPDSAPCSSGDIQNLPSSLLGSCGIRKASVQFQAARRWMSVANVPSCRSGLICERRSCSDRLHHVVHRVGDERRIFLRDVVSVLRGHDSPAVCRERRSRIWPSAQPGSNSARGAFSPLNGWPWRITIRGRLPSAPKPPGPRSSTGASQYALL